jgi:hypothetical protein
MSILATPANMCYYALIPGMIAYSPETGEEYSANANDYSFLALDQPVWDANNEPMILVTRHVVYVDVSDDEG